MIGPNYWTQTAGVELLRLADAIDIGAGPVQVAEAVNTILADPVAARVRAAAGARAIETLRQEIETAYRPALQAIARAVEP